MVHRRRSVDWTAGELFVLFAASVLFFLTVVPAVADARMFLGSASGIRVLDPRGLSPALAGFLGSFGTVVWCILRVERRATDRHRRRLIVIASQIREAREEAERQRLLQEQEEVERRRERRLNIASTLFMIAASGVGVAFLAMM